jgi:biotin carboxyl carrier protein
MKQGPGRREMLLAVGALVAFVLVPFLFWRGTWFGRPLTDAQLEQYLHDDAKPRHIQHALVQISSRLERRDPAVKRWYPRIAALAKHPVTELRRTVAWLMGQDNQSQPFHETVAALLADPDPLVRRNAALSLARFHDPAGRAELRSMLQPYVVRAPRDGVLRFRLSVGEVVNPGTLVARLEAGAPEPLEIRSPLPGKLERKIATEGAQVAAGQDLLAITPSADHVWEALRALYLVGTAEDLPDVERFRSVSREWPEKIAQQARLTAERIRTR